MGRSRYGELTFNRPPLDPQEIPIPLSSKRKTKVPTSYGAFVSDLGLHKSKKRKTSSEEEQESESNSDHSSSDNEKEPPKWEDIRQRVREIRNQIHEEADALFAFTKIQKQLQSKQTKQSQQQQK
jgi:hypothetical protein